MPLFDTHAHLDDEQLRPVLDEVLRDAINADLVGITAIGTTLETSRECVALAHAHDMIFASVGIHPNHCQDATERQWDEIQALVNRQKVVAIGETGLDRYWDYCPLEVQEHWFRKHIELSFESRKPLVIHMRECEQDILRMLAEHQRDGQVIGIMHSFAGQWETAKRCLELGMYISFAGMVTFKKSDQLRTIARQIPDDRILVETDSPYLSPHPHRGRRPNHPAMVQHTAECIAQVREMSVEDFGRLATQNARRVFGIESP